MDSGARGTPELLAADASALPGSGRSETRANLSDFGHEYIHHVDSPGGDLFEHCLAVLHSSRYRAENAHAIRSNWPRIPLPASATLLHSSAALGRQVAALLDIEQSVPGVNVSPVSPQLRVIGVLTAASAQLNPNAGDLDLTAGWGHGGKGGVTMPGKGKAVARPYTPAEVAAFAESGGDAAALLGDTTYDVHLNGKALWSNIPSAVWEYTLGGYQVIKKWLSYREKELLGRGLSKDEARHVTDMARRIAALLLMGPALDANYEAVKRENLPFREQKIICLYPLNHLTKFRPKMLVCPCYFQIGKGSRAPLARPQQFSCWPAASVACQVVLTSRRPLEA
jgi:hypothetical protein